MNLKKNLTQIPSPLLNLKEMEMMPPNRQLQNLTNTKCNICIGEKKNDFL